MSNTVKNIVFGDDLQSLIQRVEPSRIRIEWNSLDQFRSLDWEDVRHRVDQHMTVPLLRFAKRRRLTKDASSGLAEATNFSIVAEHCDALLVSAGLAGGFALLSAEDVHKWLAASLVGARLDIIPLHVKCNCLQCNRIVVIARTNVSRKVAQPKTLHDDGGHWLLGEIDAREVRLLHKKPPRWPKVLEYALRREEQVASGSTCAPPLVQISRCPLNGDWVANDGAHRLYAAMLSGLPLQCKWKRKQRTLDDLSEHERMRLLSLARDANNP